jgi:uncharacterized membrane protein YphA (DoxX/SURF4 family)
MRATTTTKSTNVTLWVGQFLLAALFLFAGVMKLVMPIDALVQQAQLPGALLRFIACAEILGALGLILPGIFRIRTELTSLAATGLVLIMTGATVIGIERGQIGGSITPFVIGAIAAFIAIRRWQWQPSRDAVQQRAIRKAA